MRMEAGDKLPPYEELWLLAWARNAPPAMKARLDKLQKARQPAKQPEPPKKDLRRGRHQGCGPDGRHRAYADCLARRGPDNPDALETMAIEFAKRGIRIIDGCHEKLGQSKMGNWCKEFEEAAEEVE